MRLLSWLVFLLLVIIEGVLTTLPLTLVFLLCLTVMKRQEWIFLLAFSAGILLDVFLLRQIGITSILFISYVFLLLLYQRKYETATMPFVMIASFVGSILYLLITAQDAVLLQGVLSTVITITAFALYSSLIKASPSDGFMRV
jgi:cell shape-determining protein MreD